MNKKSNLGLTTTIVTNSHSQGRKKEKNNLVRVQLDLPQEKIDELNIIMKKVGLETRKDLFNNALSIFAWAVKEKEKGHAILAVDEETDTYKELVMHPLEAVVSKKRKT